MGDVEIDPSYDPDHNPWDEAVNTPVYPDVSGAYPGNSVEMVVTTANARHLMGLAMLKAGYPKKSIITATRITNETYNKLEKQYGEANYDALSKPLLESWEDILRAKLMDASERVVDCIGEFIDNKDMKNAKDAAIVFEKLFDKFRLSTGQSTTNVATAQMVFQEVLEKKRKVVAPNENVVVKEVNTEPKGA